MRSGINPRPRVHFDLSPIEEPVQTSTQRTSGLRLKRRSTVRIRKTTTRGGSCTPPRFKELLSNLSEKQCQQLASALLPKAGGRATMPRRRRRRSMLPNKPRKREHETDSEDSFGESSGSYSSGAKRRRSDSRDTSDSESESSLDAANTRANYSATRTRLAPINFPRDCKPLGPWI